MNFLIHGEQGSGKTYLMFTLLELAKEPAKIFVIMVDREGETTLDGMPEIYDRKRLNLFRCWNPEKPSELLYNKVMEGIHYAHRHYKEYSFVCIDSLTSLGGERAFFSQEIDATQLTIADYQRALRKQRPQLSGKRGEGESDWGIIRYDIESAIRQLYKIPTHIFATALTTTEEKNMLYAIPLPTKGEIVWEPQPRLIPSVPTRIRETLGQFTNYTGWCFKQGIHHPDHYVTFDHGLAETKWRGPIPPDFPLKNPTMHKIAKYIKKGDESV